MTIEITPFSDLDDVRRYTTVDVDGFNKKRTKSSQCFLSGYLEAVDLAKDKK